MSKSTNILQIKSAFLFNSLFFILFLSSIFLAVNESSVRITSNVVSKFINVSMINISDQLIPNYEYKYPIIITLSLSNDSLKNINSNNVTIYVKAIIETNDGEVYFKDGQNKLNTSFLTLTCNIDISNSEYMCSKNSVSSRELEVYILSNSSKKNISAEISFYTSSTPFEDFIPILQQSDSLNNELVQLIPSLNTTDPNIQDTINKTEEALSVFHIEEAKSNIEKLKIESGKSFFFSIPSLMNRITAYIQSLFNFISSDLGYVITLSLGLIIIVSVLIFNTRKNEKISLIAILIISIILVFLKMLSITLLFLIEVVILVFVISLVYARSSSKKSFRPKD